MKSKKDSPQGLKPDLFASMPFYSAKNYPNCLKICFPTIYGMRNMILNSKVLFFYDLKADLASVRVSQKPPLNFIFLFEIAL